MTRLAGTDTSRSASALLNQSASSLFDLSGHSIIVTGAAGGLGYQMAAAAAANGAHVTMIDIDAHRLDTSVRSLRDAGLSAFGTALDVVETAALDRAISAATSRFGRLDAVFANAGISAGPGFAATPDRTVGTLQTLDQAKWDRVIAVNLTSVMHTIRLSAAQMAGRSTGRIVVTASIAGLRAEPFCNYAYAVAKAGVVNLVRQAAVELAPSGICVNAIAPGFVQTDIGGGRLNDAAVREQLASRIPMARVGRADEICGLALYLASPACSYVTGVTIPFDGGLTAC